MLPRGCSLLMIEYGKKLRQDHSQQMPGSSESQLWLKDSCLPCWTPLPLHHGLGCSNQPYSLLSFLLISVSCSLGLFWLPPHILSKRQFSNKTLAHLILPCNLPLGRPRLLHNCKWKISANIWKITSWWRSRSWCKPCDPQAHWNGKLIGIEPIPPADPETIGTWRCNLLQKARRGCIVGCNEKRLHPVKIRIQRDQATISSPRSCPPSTS